MNNLIYYVNGKFVPAGEAALPLNDLGIVRGYGVFDLLRTYSGVPFRLREHVQRLEYSAAQIGLELPWSTEELEKIAMATFQRNSLPDASIRIIVTGGPSSNFMTPQNKPSLIVMVQPVNPYSEDVYQRGTKVVTTTVERAMPTVKSINYIGAIFAMKSADPVGAVEAIYRTPQDTVTEGTRSNLFVLRDNQLITPSEGALRGITRQAVIEAASDLLDVCEETIHYADLCASEEVFLTSTTKEVLPVVQVDDCRIGDGTPGPKTQRIRELFQALVAAETRVIV
jgi:branched-chain amino acid aminotransferase